MNSDGWDELPYRLEILWGPDYKGRQGKERRIDKVGVSEPRCINLSPNGSILQYRFATSNPLKARPSPGCCRTAPLCNPVRVEIPPLQFPPFPHKQPVPRLGPQPSRARSEAKPIP